MSIEDVNTGVLEKNDEYLRSKDKAKKWYDVSGHIYLYMPKYKKMKIYYPCWDPSMLVKWALCIQCFETILVDVFISLYLDQVL